MTQPASQPAGRKQRSHGGKGAARVRVRHTPSQGTDLLVVFTYTADSTRVWCAGWWPQMWQNLPGAAGDASVVVVVEGEGIADSGAASVQQCAARQGKARPLHRR